MQLSLLSCKSGYIGAVISAILLAILLTVTVAVFTMTIFFLVKSKAKVQAELQLANQTSLHHSKELPPADINISENLAYGMISIQPTQPATT